MSEITELTDEALAAAIEKLEALYGFDSDLIELLETVQHEETVHVTDNEAGECVDDCTGCVTERIAVAVVRALNGGKSDG